MENAITIKNLSKNYYLFDKDYKKIFWLFTNRGHYGVKEALKNVTITVKKGEVVGIIGSNGAGKSTLMSLVAGITFPSAGTVEVNGTVGSLINLSAGFSNNYTGRENIYYKAELLGIHKTKIDEIIEDIETFADIGEYFDLPLKTYSSGMRGRVGFAMAISLDPDILIIDEVFSVGDREFKKKSAERTREMFAAGKSIMFSSHSDQLIKEFCNRVIYIRNGQIKFDGDVEEGLAMYNEAKKEKRKKQFRILLKK